MKTGSGKRKGGQFERDVCRALSRWITGGKRDDVFWRSAMSGGRATIAKGAVRQCGDITSVAPEGHVLTDKYFIELKFNNTLEIEQFILGGYGKLARYWQKACEEAAKYKREPLLIVKQNFAPVLVIEDHGNTDFNIDPMVDVYNNAAKTYVSIYLFEEWLAAPVPWRARTEETRADAPHRPTARIASATRSVRKAAKRRTRSE